MSVPRPAWEEPGYGEIASVDRNLGAILVTFANGDQVPIDLSSIGADEATEFVLESESGVLLARTERGERQIDWMLIRRLDDPLFAEWLRERDIEETQSIGRRLRTLRMNRGISQKNVARLAEMSAPQLAKIEKGESDLRLSTVRSVLRALGASLADISGPEAPEVPISDIQANARNSGVPGEILTSMAARLDTDLFAEVLAHGFGWDPEVLLREAPRTEPVTALKFKALDLKRARSSPLSRLAFTVSEIAAGAYDGAPKDLPADPRTIRDQLEGAVSLERLLQWAWDHGVLVVPTPGTKGAFEGAAWRAGGHQVAILSSAQAPVAFWLFDLAHELGHLALGHPEREGVVDGEKPGEAIDDEDEREANLFALDLLLPDREQLFAEIRRRCAGSLKYQKLKFKWRVIEVAEENAVDVALLATTAASALTEIAEPIDRWGSAQNIAKDQGDARPLVRKAFSERIDLDSLDELDRALIEAVVLE
jgi:transcriptional regulator with XRE-family HTH domain/Zn-dependent peptidase ImmA (M78 family)